MNRFNERHERSAHKNRLQVLWAGIAMMIVAAVLGIVTDFSYPASILAALGIFLLIAFLVNLKRKPWCCIHPYFKRELPPPGAETMLRGTAIAGYLDELDAALEKAGVRTISSFGFKDSYKNSECDWYRPCEGMATFRAVLKIALADADRYGGVIDETLAILAALDLAESAGIDFCLHMRMLAGMSTYESERREGAYR